MVAGPWTFTNSFREKLFRGQFDFDTDVFNVALFLSTSNISAASTTYTGITNQHANANGYTTGGITVTFGFGGTPPAMTLMFSPNNPIWTATGGNIVARWAVLYEVGGDVVAFCLLDATNADVTAPATNTFTVDSDGTPNVFLTAA